MENKNSVNIFSEPEKIDAMINSRLAQFPRKGGKTCSKNVSWSDDELQLIDGVIWSYITEQGLSREATALQLFNRWDISMSTARRYVVDSIKRMTKSFPEEEMEEKRNMWMERCTQILQQAIDSGDKTNALKALDLMAKSMGLYQTKTDVNLSGSADITFDFQ